MTTASPELAPPSKESVKETLISILIAFVLAFVFRSFVVEAFIIPTGSMAPTLLGAHMRFANSETGANWTVGPWIYDPRTREPLSVQGDTAPVIVHDPISGEALSRTSVPLRSGDRILVEKFLYGVREPQRFDVVVFKNPSDPNQNYIKRLIGLPNEEIALVDGDVFTRKADSATNPTAPTATTSPNSNRWTEPGWQIARKDSRVMKSVWQDVFDAAKTPLSFGQVTAAAFKFPWVGASETPNAWVVSDGLTLPRGQITCTTSKRAALSWNNQQSFFSSLSQGGRDFDRTITDRYAYNEPAPRSSIQTNYFPVSDVRVSAGIKPEQAGLAYRVVLQARGHIFIGEVAGGKATLKMRPIEPLDGPFTTLATGDATLPAGRVTAVEFWHHDQSLRLLIGGREVAAGTYDWTPQQRIAFATGRTLSELMERQKTVSGNILADPNLYRPAQLRIELEGSPASIFGLKLDRDLHYQPATYPLGTGEFGGQPAVATSPETTIHLEPNQFFVCGDNSPQSMDSRLWNRPDPSIEALMLSRGMKNTVGVVSRDLMLGRAFHVYFPSMLQGGLVPVPDVGRMRFIQ